MHNTAVGVGTGVARGRAGRAHLGARACHQFGRDRVDLVLHRHLDALDRDEQHAEVGASEVEGEEVTLLCNKRVAGLIDRSNARGRSADSLHQRSVNAGPRAKFGP